MLRGTGRGSVYEGCRGATGATPATCGEPAAGVTREDR